MIRNIRNPYLDLKEQRRQLDLVHMLNDLHSYRQKKDERLEPEPVLRDGLQDAD